MLLIVKKEAKMCGHELQESMRFTEEVRFELHFVSYTSHQDGLAFASVEQPMLGCLYCNGCRLA